MVTWVTQFVVIEDTQQFMAKPGSEAVTTVGFTLPGLPPAVDRRGPAVLAWVVDTDDPGQQLEVSLNSTKLTLTAALPGDAYQTLHEVITGNQIALLKSEPQSNLVTFKLVTSKPQGHMRYSDVVMWYKYMT